MRTRVVLAAAVWLTAGWMNAATATAGWPAIVEHHAEPAEASPIDGGRAAAERVIDGIAQPPLQALLRQVLSANPALQRAELQALSGAVEARVAGYLPDPMLSGTIYPRGPQTRTGEQLFGVEARQDLPARGSLATERQGAQVRAEAARAESAALALSLVTRGRELYHQLERVEARREVLSELRTHLEHHEEIARSQYATGVGSSQEVIKLQAEISMVGARILEVEAERSTAVVRLNALRDQPASAPIEVTEESELAETGDLVEVEAASLACRPDLVAAAARVEAAGVEVEAERLRQKPEFFVAFGYTWVENRDDPAGIVNPPVDNGDDVIALRGGVRLPLYGKARTGRIEAVDLQRRAVLAAEDEVERRASAEVEELAALMPLQLERLRVVRELVIVQAEEAMRSARAGYTVGRLSALDVLHASHRLFDARLEAVDLGYAYQLSRVRLEAALGLPLSAVNSVEECRS